MPTYQYVCTACGERLEAVQSFSDDALTECPACAGALRKVFSSVGVVFKGSGFYKTDSRDSAKPAAAAAAKTDGGSSDGNGSAGSAGSSTPAAPSTAAPAASTSTPSSTSGSGSSSTGSSAKSTPAA